LFVVGDSSPEWRAEARIMNLNRTVIGSGLRMLRG